MRWRWYVFEYVAGCRSVLMQRYSAAGGYWAAAAGSCCRVLQSVAECCRVLQSVAGCCRVLQGVAECCRVLQSVAVCCSTLQYTVVRCSELQRDATRCNTQNRSALLIVSFVTRQIDKRLDTSTFFFFNGYCSTVQGLLDWFEVDLGFTELSLIQIDQRLDSFNIFFFDSTWHNTHLECSFIHTYLFRNE